MYDDWGVANGYHDVDGVWREAPHETIEALRAAIGEPPTSDPLWFVPSGTDHSLWGRCAIVLEDGTNVGEHDHLPSSLPNGYHTLHPLDGGPSTALVVHPVTCPEPPRTWGVAAQVASLWRPQSWGIGDLSDVADLSAHVRRHGGGAVLLSPLHAPSPSFPQEDSPYYPSTRRWLNPMAIPISGLPPSTIDNTPGGLIDRNTVWAAKRQALAALFEAERHDGAWQAWAAALGPALQRYAAWCALADEFGAEWRRWPDVYRHPDHPAVDQRSRTDDGFVVACQFHAWCQWLAHRALDDASRAGSGLIGDLAVGCSPNGFDCWMDQDVMALDVRIGAPPDTFNTAGQDWGLPPYEPRRLRAAHYRPYIDMLRSALRSMAGLRIDHVMGLFRQYWIPGTGGPRDGTYVRMQPDELLALICLEAERAGAFVIGEDLGTVEAHVRHELGTRRVMSTKVFWFDADTSEWPPLSLGTVTTHDLPTLAGVLAGTDGTDDMRASLHVLGEQPSAAVHAALASSPSAIVLASIDDLAGSPDRPNLPGTIGDVHPNWRLRLPHSAGELMDSGPGAAMVHALAADHSRVSTSRTGDTAS